VQRWHFILYATGTMKNLNKFRDFAAKKNNINNQIGKTLTGW
jgi:hypothetical protein